ncbi:hypothetical protein [Acidianus sulfidivorans]|nr:hypothetical protein [Acidianus sulfidivorans]
MYKTLREKFKLKARLAEDCYHDAVSTYKVVKESKERKISSN